MKLYQDREWLYQKYWNEELNEREIGNICGTSYRNVGVQLHKFNILIHSNSEATSLRYKKENKNKLYTDEGWLRKKYIDECLDPNQIGKICGVSKSNIGKWLVRLNIPKRSMSEAQKNSKYIWSLESRNKLSEAQKKRNNPNYNICPICGKRFKTSHKKRICCSKKCGSIRQSGFLKKQWIKKICQYCGKEFEVTPSKEKRKTCSYECSGLLRRGKRIKKICEVCGTEFEVTPCNINRKYCGENCQNVAHSKRMTGEGNSIYGTIRSEETRLKIGEANSNPSEEVRKRLSEGQIKYNINPEIIEMRWDKKIHTYCDYCGEPIVIFPCEYNYCKNHFCNNECWFDYKKANPMLGEDNPHYLNGKSNEPYPLEFNEILRRIIRKRDNYNCQMCGMTQEENIAKNGEKLSVHHIDYDKDNLNEDNLISLCKICHCKTSYNREFYIEYFKDKLKELPDEFIKIEKPFQLSLAI